MCYTFWGSCLLWSRDLLKKKLKTKLFNVISIAVCFSLKNKSVAFINGNDLHVSFFVQYHGHAKMTLFKFDWACAINDAVTTRPMFGLFSA